MEDIEEHLAKLKMKPFQSTGKKRETVGILLTPIFVGCGVPLDDAEMDDRIVYMVQLTSRAHSGSKMTATGVSGMRTAYTW